MAKFDLDSHQDEIAIIGMAGRFPGAKTVAENLLAGYYVRQLFKQDQEVILAGGKGKIKQIHSLGVVMETEEGEIMVPNHKIVEKTPKGTTKQKVNIKLHVEGKVIGNGEDTLYIFTDKTYKSKKYSL